MDKLKLAHEWAMNTINAGYCNETKLMVKEAWKYADAMQAEADKRNKAEAAQKRKEVREILNDANTFIEREDKTRPEVLEEWQPDWSQAPHNAEYWAMDGCGQCNWYAIKPEVCGNQWDFGRVIEQAHTGYGYQDNWQDSLRKRPQ